MNNLKRMQMCQIKFTTLVGFIFIITTLLIFSAHADLPFVPMVVSTSDNTLLPEDGSIVPEGVAPSGGGSFGVADGKGLYTSFGQSFPGRVAMKETLAELEKFAKKLYEEGSIFLRTHEIIKLGDVGESELDNLKNTFDSTKLAEAEAAYRRLLYLDPYNEDYVTGILKVRQAYAYKTHLVWDIKRNLQFRKRLTDNEPENSDNSRILSAEINILKTIGEMQWTSNAFLLELFSDSQYRGVGALLRREYKLLTEDVVDTTYNLIFNGVRRYLEGEIERGRKLLLLNFFNEGSVTEASTRNNAVNVLLSAETYATESLRLLNPYLATASISKGNGSPGNGESANSDIMRIVGLSTEASELAAFVQQGYNPFGFLPDFVPYLTGTNESDNLGTYNTLVSIAVDSCREAYTIEDKIKDEAQILVKTQDEYKTRLQELTSSYFQRLITIVGSVTIPFGTETVTIPDIFTYFSPDMVLDNTGVTARDMLRAKLTAQKPGYVFGSKGTLSGQYDIIVMADSKIEIALNDIKNNYANIEDEEYTARKITELYEDMITLKLSTGKTLGAMAREKGRLQKIAAEEAGRIQRDSNCWRWMHKKAYNFFNNKSGFSADALLYMNPTLALGKTFTLGVEDYNTANSYWYSQDKEPVSGLAIAGFVVSVASFMVTVGQSLLSADAAFEIGQVQGQLAEDVANIDAAMEEVRAMEQAQMLWYQNRIDLERSAQRMRELTRAQANFELSYHIAVRDACREKKALATLLDEATRLIYDFHRSTKLLEETSGHVLGWQDLDVREALSNDMLIAEKAFHRAQMWTFIALRALEYYANRPPEANGQPNKTIRSFYNRLYAARRSEDLVGTSNTVVGGLLGVMNAAIKSDFVFSITSTTCPGRGVLSLKYDVVIPTTATYRVDTGEATPDEGGYVYIDPETNTRYEGNRAYQAAFRNMLKKSLSGPKTNRSLKIIFGTHLFPAMTTESTSSSNPFFTASSRNEKIVGFPNDRCAGEGVTPNVHGLQINIIGGSVDVFPKILLEMAGNSYLKHTSWSNSDFGVDGKLKDPMKAISVYSSYQQILPSWLGADLGLKSATKAYMEKLNDACPPGCDCIGSNVSASIEVLRNGQGKPGTQPKTLAFTDRAVANDKWVLEINDTECDANKTFLNGLETMLNSPVPNDPLDDYITDIQIWIGWAYRNPS